MLYRISNGEVLWEGDAADRIDACDRMAKDYQFASYRAMYEHAFDGGPESYNAAVGCPYLTLEQFRDELLIEEVPS